MVEYRNVAIIASSKDPAGTNILHSLQVSLNCEEGKEFNGHPTHTVRLPSREVRLLTTDKDSVHAEHIDWELSGWGFKPDLIIFCSKHKATGGVKSLTCHAIGNWGEATLGGTQGELVPAPASALKATYKALVEEAESIGWTASMEATHHGPEVDVPTMFVEIGSSEKEWGYPPAGQAVARAIKSALTFPLPKVQSVLVLGGGHYSHYAEKVQLQSEAAVGHICPKFNLPLLDQEMIEQALTKMTGKEHMVLLDWKGLGKEKQRIQTILEHEHILHDRSDHFFLH